MIKYIKQNNNINLKFDLKFWIINISFWTIPALLSTTITYFSSIQSGVSENWFIHFLGQSPNWYAWCLLTPVVITLATILIISKANRLKYVAIHILLSLIMSCLHITILMLSYIPLGLKLFSEQFYSTLDFLLLYTTQLNIVVYFSILGVYYMISYFLMHRENEVQIAQLETKLALGHLHSLKEQIHPHFLFNTLNMLTSYIRTDSREKAVQIVSDLSDLLRSSFDTSNKQFHSLEEEINFINKYLQLIECRFQDKLKIKVDVSDNIYDALVPSLILQPIVENALKHGVEKLSSSGIISVTIYKENIELIFEIVNTVSDEIAKSLDCNKLNGGYSITVERLKLLYNNSATIDLKLTQPKLVCCRIKIPYRTEIDSK